ncbi:hypothetical protein D1B31_14040 [Neobacillus notoginsengisoli]|uniref:Group-specific protein n=1 Tax=Neobacillus notoginsengisoli TaxID=1578198 RepID=A0A417YST7_9BACI|nr:hypothetical protein [Neobacillus notoginsengisoli]RHW39075.1 hypothetical protein D1B31_14040 [Neobacillus notoginsengisoli]
MKKFIITVLLAGLIPTTNAAAQTERPIEIFDVMKGKVILTTKSTPNVQREVKKYIEGITGVFPKINPIPSEGFMIRVPLEPAVIVNTQLFRGPVNEVIIIFSGQEEPYLMFLDDKNRLLVFTFKGNTDRLLELLNFKRFRPLKHQD